MDGFEGIENAISQERFAAYLESCHNNRATALDLYSHNTKVSSALYAAIQTLEVTMRNVFHEQLSAAYGTEWYLQPNVISHLFQRRKISSAMLDLAHSRKPLESGRVVASLTFGFWTACLTAQYDDNLWRKGGLAKAFQNSGEKPSRKEVNRKLTPIRQIRNRIAHHEPILYFNLPKHHNNIIELTRWLSPVAAEWSVEHCTFNTCYCEEFAKTMTNPKDRA